MDGWKRRRMRALSDLFSPQFLLCGPTCRVEHRRVSFLLHLLYSETTTSPAEGTDDGDRKADSFWNGKAPGEVRMRACVRE